MTAAVLTPAVSPVPDPISIIVIGRLCDRQTLRLAGYVVA